RHRVRGLPDEQPSVEGRRGVRVGLAGVHPAGNTGEVTVSLWHRVLLPVAHRWRPYSWVCQTAASAVIYVRTLGMGKWRGWGPSGAWCTPRRDEAPQRPAPQLRARPPPPPPAHPPARAARPRAGP